MKKNTMYPSDTFLKNFIHNINNQIMVVNINLDELKEHFKNNYKDDTFVAENIKKQEEYFLKISEQVKELKNEMKEALLAKPQEIKQLSGRVLVVDDEEDLLHIMKRYLSKLGLEVEAVTSGEEALHLLRNKIYHFLITDLKMPEMDGQTFIRIGKEENLFEDTVVIAITGGLLNEYSQEQRAALSENVDGFLQKPFSKDELFSLLCSFEPV